MKAISRLLLLTLFLLSGKMSEAQSTLGLVAHWNMDSSAADVSGNGHEGHTHNVIADTGMDGIYGHSFYFNGVNSYITTAASSAYNLSNFSICAIVKVEGFYTGTCQANIILLRGKTGPGVGGYDLEFKDKPTTNYDCSTYDTTKETFWSWASGFTTGSITDFYYTPPIVKNKWYKVISTFNDTVFRIYVNDTLKASAYVTTPGVPMGVSSDSMCIGYNIYEAAFGYPYAFKGDIDDIMLYNRVLSDSEIVHYGDTCGRIVSEPTNLTSEIGGVAVYSIGSSIPGASFQWQQDGGTGYVNLTNSGPYSGVYTPTLTITGITSAVINDHYRCIVNNSWGCADTSTSALLTLDIKKVEEGDNIKLFPNPATSKLTIETLGYEKELLATIYSTNGVEQMSVKVTSKTEKIDITNIPAGIYFVKLTSENGSIYKEFLKE